MTIININRFLINRSKGWHRFPSPRITTRCQRRNKKNYCSRSQSPMLSICIYLSWARSSILMTAVCWNAHVFLLFFFLVNLYIFLLNPSTICLAIKAWRFRSINLFRCVLCYWARLIVYRFDKATTTARFNNIENKNNKVRIFRIIP